MTSGGLHDRRLLHGALAVSAIFLMIAEREFLDLGVIGAEFLGHADDDAHQRIPPAARTRSRPATPSSPT